MFTPSAKLDAQPVLAFFGANVFLSYFCLYTTLLFTASCLSQEDNRHQTVVDRSVRRNHYDGDVGFGGKMAPLALLNHGQADLLPSSAIIYPKTHLAQFHRRGVNIVTTLNKGDGFLFQAARHTKLLLDSKATFCSHARQCLAAERMGRLYFPPSANSFDFDARCDRVCVR